MTAHPDVPDTPDRTDAIARALERADGEPPTTEERETIAWVLATDDPAAVAAIAAQWAERHPDALLHDPAVLAALAAQIDRVRGRLWEWESCGPKQQSTRDVIDSIRGVVGGDRFPTYPTRAALDGGDGR